MTTIKKAGWQAGLNNYFYSYSTRLAALIVVASTCGAGMALLIVLALVWIGAAL